LLAVWLSMLLGKRKGFPNDLAVPHRPAIVMMGASMLWVGWFGFNGGSQLAADGGAGMALLVTHIAASVGTLVWVTIEAITHKKPTLVGAATGTIAGLATVTPAGTGSGRSAADRPCGWTALLFRRSPYPREIENR